MQGYSSFWKDTDVCVCVRVRVRAVKRKFTKAYQV